MGRRQGSCPSAGCRRRRLPQPCPCVRISDFPSQPPDGRRGIAVRRTFVFPVPQLSSRSSLRLFDEFDKLIAVWRFRAFGVVFRLQGPQGPLHRPAVIGSVVVLSVQDQPQFEAGVGAPDANPVSLAKRYRLVEAGMVVPIEDCPDLVMFLERVPSAAAALRRRYMRKCLLGNRIGNADSRNDLDGNQCARTRVLECCEIGRLGIPAFAEQNEPSSRFQARSASLQARNDAGGHPSSACQGSKWDRRKARHRNGPVGTLFLCCPPYGSDSRSTDIAASRRTRLSR